MKHILLKTGTCALCVLLLPWQVLAAEELVFENDSTRAFTARTLLIDQTDRGGNLTLQFGTTLNKQILWDTARQRFRITGSLDVQGTLSGSTLHAESMLTSSGGLLVKGNMSGSTLAGAGLTNCSTNAIDKLLYDSTTKKFSCGTDQSGGSVGNGSGNILFLNAVYPHAVYFGSGSATAGQLTNNYDITNNKNFYRWTTSQSTLNDYWISVNVRLPDNFSSWDPVKPTEFRYRTTGGSSSDQYITLRMIDTSGANVALTGASSLTNTSWTVATITGPESAGTFTPRNYITIFVKLAAKAGFNADASYINLNFETTTP